MIGAALQRTGLPRRDQADHIFTAPRAVADDELAQHGTQTKEDESVVLGGVIGIGNQEGVLVKEDRSSFLKGYAGRTAVSDVLALVPFEAQFGHLTTS